MNLWNRTAGFLALGAFVVVIDALNEQRESTPTRTGARDTDAGEFSPVATEMNVVIEADGEPTPTMSEDGHVAAAMGPHPLENELSRKWDEFTLGQRVATQQRQFRLAIQSMRRGEDFDANRAEADSALSGLRADMYGTDAGRRAHRRMEVELEKLVDTKRARRSTMDGEEGR